MNNILLINLDSATERLAFQQQQFAELGLTFERLPACRLNHQTDPLYLKYHASWERKLSLAEVSCFLSHKQAWHRVVAEQQPMLILEDDALLAANLNVLLPQVSKLKGLDYLNLEARGRNKKKLLAKQASYTLAATQVFRLFQGRSGAAGYIIWPQGASKLLNKIDVEGIGLADKFINATYELLAYQMEPAPIIQLDQCKLFGLEPPIAISTSIGARPTAPAMLSKRFWIYTYRRIKGQIYIALNQLKNIQRAKRRNIAISPDLLKQKRVAENTD